MPCGGDGPARREMEDLSVRQGLSGIVRFLGYLDQDVLAQGYDAADLFVFASLTETQGLVITEAMAVGTPVVAVEEMGVADIMRGDFGGFLVPLDLEEFTEKIVDMFAPRLVLGISDELSPPGDIEKVRLVSEIVSGARKNGG